MSFSEFRRDLAYASTNYYEPALKFLASELPKSGALLDLGCGPGILCKEYARLNPDFQVVGVDRSKVMLAFANYQKLSNCTFIKADLTRIPWHDDSFRSAVAVRVAHHWTNPVQVMAETKRLLVSKGVFYIYDSSPDLHIPPDLIKRRFGWPSDQRLKRTWSKYSVGDLNPLRLLGMELGFEDGGQDKVGFYRRLKLVVP